MIIKYLKTYRMVKTIKAASRLTPSMKKKIAQFEPDELEKISEIAKQMKKNGEKNRLTPILKLIIENPMAFSKATKSDTSEPGFSRETIGKIAQFEPNEIKKISEIAKQMKKNGEKNRFALILKLIIENPLDFSKDTKSEKSTSDFAEQIVQAHLGSIFKTIEKEMPFNLPGGCYLKKQLIKKKSLDYILTDENVNDDYLPALKAHLQKTIRENPSQFIHGYNYWIESQAKIVLESVRKKFSKDIPEGCSLNDIECVEAIKGFYSVSKSANIFNVENLHDAAAEDLSKKINTLPIYYIDGFSRLINDQAEEIFSHLDAQISKSLTNGISLFKDNCIRLISNKILTGVDASQLIESIMRECNENPELYLLKDGKPLFQPIRSSPTYAGGQDFASAVTKKK